METPENWTQTSHNCEGINEGTLFPVEKIDELLQQT